MLDQCASQPHSAGIVRNSLLLTISIMSSCSQRWMRRLTKVSGRHCWGCSQRLHARLQVSNLRRLAFACRRLAGCSLSLVFPILYRGRRRLVPRANARTDTPASCSAKIWVFIPPGKSLYTSWIFSKFKVYSNLKCPHFIGEIPITGNLTWEMQ